MSQLFSILIIVGGGLGTFLLGMKHLSEGLQAVSGSGLRRFMSLATSHRLAGVGTGVITTVIVQSSSIITVMVVGFVSSGLMNLSQAINVITTLFFLPFTRQFARFVSRIIKALPAEKPHLSVLKMHSYISPIIACDQALLEVGFMRDSNLELLAGVNDVLAETVSGLIKSPRPRFDLAALQANSHDIGGRIRNARRNQLDRVGPDDPDSPVRVLAELDILNAYERIRSCYINMAETLAGRK